MEEKKIKVRILPLHNIGGVGKAGDVVWMSAAEAEMYIRDGYVEVVEDVPEGSPSTALAESARSAQDEAPQEDHKIMKPPPLRLRSARRK